MPSGSFSKNARYTTSITNKKNCGGNKKAGLAPRATGPTEFRNVAFDTHPTVNFKVHKGGLPCPENYSNNSGGQCSGGVGALASTRNRGCRNIGNGHRTRTTITMAQALAQGGVRGYQDLVINKTTINRGYNTGLFIEGTKFIISKNATVSIDIVGSQTSTTYIISLYNNAILVNYGKISVNRLISKDFALGIYCYNGSELKNRQGGIIEFGEIIGTVDQSIGYGVQVNVNSRLINDGKISFDRITSQNQSYGLTSFSSSEIRNGQTGIIEFGEITVRDGVFNGGMYSQEGVISNDGKISFGTITKTSTLSSFQAFGIDMVFSNFRNGQTGIIEFNGNIGNIGESVLDQQCYGISLIGSDQTETLEFLNNGQISFSNIIVSGYYASGIYTSDNVAISNGGSIIFNDITNQGFYVLGIWLNGGDNSIINEENSSIIFNNFTGGNQLFGIYSPTDSNSIVMNTNSNIRFEFETTLPLDFVPPVATGFVSGGGEITYGSPDRTFYYPVPSAALSSSKGTVGNIVPPKRPLLQKNDREKLNSFDTKFNNYDVRYVTK